MDAKICAPSFLRRQESHEIQAVYDLVIPAQGGISRKTKGFYLVFFFLAIRFNLMRFLPPQE